MTNPQEKIPVVLVQHLHKTYGSVRALRDVTLRVDAGEVVAVLGPNGAGKSTLFGALLGMVAPSAGEVLVFGRRPSRSTRLRTGVMLQSAGLPEAVTVAELVKLVGRPHAWSLPPQLALERVALRGLTTRRVTELSGGERQRLQLAMALVGAPDLLVLDEPTAALDLQARRTFWQLARQAATLGVTVLFATHDLAEASTVADRVIVLSRGQVVGDAGPEELAGDGDRDLETVFLRLTEEASIATQDPLC